MSGLMLFLFILQILVAIFLIIIVLFQSSDEDSLGGIGAGASKTNHLARRSSIDGITKTTIILGVILMINSIFLTMLSSKKYGVKKSLVKDYIEQEAKKEKSEEELKKDIETVNKISEVLEIKK